MMNYMNTTQELNLFPTTNQQALSPVKFHAPTQSLLTNLIPNHQKTQSIEQQILSHENLSASTTCDSDNDSLSSTPIKDQFNLNIFSKNSSFKSLNNTTPTNVFVNNTNNNSNNVYNSYTTTQTVNLNTSGVQQQPKKDGQNYKTELCRNFVQNGGVCQYGKKCRYAHGTDEITYKANVSEFYKTRDCKLFHQDGYCSYGIRCHFIHVNKNLEDVKRDSQLKVSDKLKYGIIGEKKSSRFNFVEPKAPETFQEFQMLQQQTETKDVKQEQSRFLMDQQQYQEQYYQFEQQQQQSQQIQQQQYYNDQTCKVLSN